MVPMKTLRRQAVASGSIIMGTTCDASADSIFEILWSKTREIIQARIQVTLLKCHRQGLPIVPGIAMALHA